MSADLLIRGAQVLTPDAPLRHADIAIADGTISEIGDRLRRSAGVVIDATGSVAIPGSINAHTHSGQHLDRGVAPGLPLDLWLIWVVHGGVDLDPSDSYTLASAGAAEMLETGCTAVLDHAWVPETGFADHTEAIMSAYADTGIRAVLAPMIQDRDIFESMSFAGVEADPPEPLSSASDPAVLIDAMSNFLQRWAAAHPLLRPAVGPSAPQRCSNDLLVGLAELARNHRSLFHTHVLETKAQVFATRERYGRSTLEELATLGVLDERASLAHGVWLDANEYGLVRDCGATIVHSPVSNLRLGSGLLPLAGLLDGGVSVALGADGAASNDDQNMFGAMKLAATMHTLSGPFERWPTADQIWRCCLTGGARALGQPVGALRPGAAADVVLIDDSRHVARHAEAMTRSLVFAERGDAVRTVIVGGRVVVEDGALITGDRTERRRRERALQERIHDAEPSRRAVYDRHAEVLAAVHHHAMAMPCSVQRLAPTTRAFGGEPNR